MQKQELKEARNLGTLYGKIQFFDDLQPTNKETEKYKSMIDRLSDQEFEVMHQLKKYTKDIHQKSDLSIRAKRHKLKEKKISYSVNYLEHNVELAPKISQISRVNQLYNSIVTDQNIEKARYLKDNRNILKMQVSEM